MSSYRLAFVVDQETQTLEPIPGDSFSFNSTDEASQNKDRALEWLLKIYGTRLQPHELYIVPSTEFTECNTQEY